MIWFTLRALFQQSPTHRTGSSGRHGNHLKGPCNPSPSVLAAKGPGGHRLGYCLIMGCDVEMPWRYTYSQNKLCGCETWWSAFPMEVLRFHLPSSPASVEENISLSLFRFITLFLSLCLFDSRSLSHTLPLSLSHTRSLSQSHCFSLSISHSQSHCFSLSPTLSNTVSLSLPLSVTVSISEDRRVGKACRSRWAPDL